MADTYLTPCAATTLRRTQIGPWMLQERPARACVCVTARRDQTAQVAQEMQRRAGAPVGLGDLVTGTDYQIMGTASGQWFVHKDHSMQRDLVADLRHVLGPIASIAEQSDAWATFTLIGAKATAVLERLVMMDLSRLQTGRVQRGILEHMNVFVSCHQHQEHYEIMVTRSYAHSLHHAMTRAMSAAAALNTPTSPPGK